MLYTGNMNNKTTLLPYLNFNGNCKEAMEFYQSVFGGNLEISTFRDSHADEGLDEDYKDKVMHSTLMGGPIEFMASDGMPGRDVIFGDSVQMSLSGFDDPTLTQYFNALSEGASGVMPLAPQVWGDKFGMLTDKFGIKWLVNISSADKLEQPAA
jgi:PhnB protein